MGKKLSHKTYGTGFGDVTDSLPASTDLLELVAKASELIVTVFGESELTLGRKVQLELLLKMYKDRLFDELRIA